MGPGDGLVLWVLVMILNANAAAELELKEYAQFTLEPSDVVVTEGDDTVLKCRAVAKTTPNITWRKNWFPVNFDSRIQLLSDGSLKISGVRSSDGAGYQCVATVKSDVDLIVVSRLAMVKIAELKTPNKNTFRVEGGAEGDTVRFTCAVTSSPPNPIISWTFNNAPTPLSPGDKYVMLPGGILQVRNINTKDAGIYRCLVTNPVSGEQRYGGINRLHYVMRPQGPLYPPKFVVRPRSATVSNGTKAVIECVVNGNPKPNITWMNTDKKEKVKYDDRVTIVGESNLQFDPITIEDAGHYSCSVNDEMVEQARLVVDYKPRFTIKPNDTQVAPGGDVRLSCAAVGEHVPAIYWLKSGEYIAHEEGRMINGYLDISGLEREDTGVYQCFAENDEDNIQTAALLRVVGPTVDIPVRSIFIDTSLKCISTVSRRVPCTVKHQDFVGWFGPDGQRIDATDPSQRVYVDSGASNTLVIKNITDQDGGNYTCRGSITNNGFALFVGEKIE